MRELRARKRGALAQGGEPVGVGPGSAAAERVSGSQDCLGSADGARGEAAGRGDQAGAAARATVCFEGRLEPQVRFPKMNEEEYVALELADVGTIDPQRIERAERDARWRYNGYCCGKVALL